jgi:hypothetical protein
MATASKKKLYTAMSMGVIDASLLELQIEVGDAKTVPAKVQLLLKFFKQKKAKLADCTVCQGSSDEDFPRCPYCGDSTFIDPNEAASPGVLTEAANTIIENAAPAKPKRVKAHLTIKDLDKAVAKANKHKSEAARQCWEFGNAVLKIFDANLWKLRTTAEGAVAYKSFNKFCTDELELSHTQVYRYMSVCKAYDEKTIAEHGPQKLALTVNLPEDERKRLLAEIKGGASWRELEEERKRVVQNNAGTRTPPVQTQEQVRGARDVAIMVRAPKSIEIGLLGVNNKGKPAQTLADDPWGEEEHENGVITRYAIKADPNTGNLCIVITRRRAAAK